MKEINVVEMVVGTFLNRVQSLVEDEVPTTEAMNQLLQAMHSHAVAAKKQAEVIEELVYYTMKFSGDKVIPDDAPAPIQFFLRSVHERLICENEGNEGKDSQRVPSEPSGPGAS